MSTTAVVKRIKANFARSAAKPWFGRQSGRGPELKAVDWAASGTMDQASATTPILVTPIAQGTEMYQRTGRKVKLRSIQLKGEVSLADPGSGATAPSEAYPIRFAIVYDDQPNGTLPSVADMFQALDSSATTYNWPFAPINLNNRDRFKILKDWVFTLKPGSNAGTSASYADGFHGCKDLTFYKKIDFDMIFNGSGSGIGTIQTGAIYVVAYQQVGAQANGIVGTYRFITRLRYVDP